jgi:hypothetical protein
MANDMAQTNQCLITGRIAYAYNGTDAKPLACSNDRYLYVQNHIEKTVGTSLLALQAVAASTMATSSVLSLIYTQKATIFIDHGRTVVTAWGAAGGTKYIVQGSPQSAGNDTWVSMTTFAAGSTIAVAIVADGDAAAGASTIACGTAVGLPGDQVFWANSTTAANGEFGTIKSVSGTADFTLLDALRYGQDSDTNIFTQAEHFVYNFDASAYTRARVLVNNNIAAGTTAAIQCRVTAITQE